jgi:3-hydroxyisobutyrate dehydrogenase-like beta-hydroxyacid dehydrogenase
MEKGYTVTGHNRTRAKAEPLIAQGLQWADTPREVCQAAEYTIVQVSDSSALQAVAEGPDGLLAGLGPGKVLLDMGTNSPAGSRRLAEQVRATGARMVDAPVSGGGATLRQGRMSVMVGGDADVFERIKPFLQEIGPKVTHVGGNGVAMAMKIAVNLNLAVQFLAFSEAVLLAEKSGIARATAVEVLLNSVVASPCLQYRGPSVLREPDPSMFWNVRMMQKDMVLATEMGRALDVPLPTTSATQEYLVAARGMGMAEEDCSVMFKVLARMAGVES